jgi:hypothetical protein
VAGSCEERDDPTSFIKGRKFLKQVLGDCFLKKGSALRSQCCSFFSYC